MSMAVFVAGCPAQAASVDAAAEGVVCDGRADIGPPLQAILDRLPIAGSLEVELPAGDCRIATPVVIGKAAHLVGRGFSESGVAAGGTWLQIDRPGFVPLTFRGPGARGAVLRDLAVIEIQPAPGPNWQPAPYEFAVEVDDTLGEVTIDNLFLYGVTRGIRARNSGRLQIGRLLGQVYAVGVDIDDSYDASRIERIHFWPYVSTSKPVMAYQESHLDAVVLRRVDGIFLGDIFALGAHSVLHLTTGAHGITNKAYVDDLYADSATYGIWIDGPATTLQAANVTTQADDAASSGKPLPGSKGMFIDTTGVVVQVGNWLTDLAGAAAVDVAGSANRAEFGSIRVVAYDREGAGTPAIRVADTPGNVVVIGSSSISGGGQSARLSRVKLAQLLEGVFEGSTRTRLATGAGDQLLIDDNGVYGFTANGSFSAGQSIKLYFEQPGVMNNNFISVPNGGPMTIADFNGVNIATHAGPKVAISDVPGDIRMLVPTSLPAYALTQLPPASRFPFGLIRVTAGPPGTSPFAYSDGARWRWVASNAAVD